MDFSWYYFVVLVRLRSIMTKLGSTVIFLKPSNIFFFRFHLLLIGHVEAGTWQWWCFIWEANLVQNKVTPNMTTPPFESKVWVSLLTECYYASALLTCVIFVRTNSKWIGLELSTLSIQINMWHALSCIVKIYVLVARPHNFTNVKYWFKCLRQEVLKKFSCTGTIHSMSLLKDIEMERS